MNTVKLYLLRHGQVPQVEPRRYLGQRDVSLDDEGRRQAKRMAERLASIPFDSAFCSSLSRARETMELLVEPHDITFFPSPVIREIALGEWEGLTTDEVRERFPGEYERRGEDMAGYRTPGGESFQDVQQRAIEFLRLMSVAPSVVLAVAHGGFNRALLCHVLGKDLSDLFSIKQDYCCLNILEYDMDRETWRVESMNETV